MTKLITIWDHNWLLLILLKISVKKGLMVDSAIKEEAIILIIYHQDKGSWLKV